MLELFRKGLHLGIGAISITREKAEKAVQELVKKGEVTSEEAKNLVEQMVERGREERQHLQDAITAEWEKIRKDSRFVTREEFIKLEERIIALEEKLEK